jgi:HSP20 family protein
MPFRPWQPTHTLAKLRREMDRLISGVLGGLPDGGVWTLVRGQPALNLWETADTVNVEMEIPGVKGEQLDISVVGDQLTVKVDRPDPEQEGVTYHRRERPVGTFTRVVTLPSEIDADHVEAELRNGVLLIRLPKAATARPRKIQVASTPS